MEAPRNPLTPPADRGVLVHWVPVLLWMGLISTLSGDPFSASNTHRYIDPVLRYFFPELTQAGFVRAHSVIRKCAHFSEFFVLGALTYGALRRRRVPAWRVAWALQAIAIAAAFSLLDELHQVFVPSRTGSLFDSSIDTLGATASQVVNFARHRWMRSSGGPD